MEEVYSVIIRTKNSAITLDACLSSILNQTIRPKKIVIVDAGSSENTLTIAKKYNTEIVSYPNELEFNYSKSLNIGVSRIKSDKILILSSHVEIIHPESLRNMISLLEKEEKCIAVSMLRTSLKKKTESNTE